MHVFEVRASSSSPRLPLCQISFLSWPLLLSLRKIGLFDAPGTKALALQNINRKIQIHNWHILQTLHSDLWHRLPSNCANVSTHTTHSLKTGKRGFRYLVPTFWNGLPLDVKLSQTKISTYLHSSCINHQCCQLATASLYSVHLINVCIIVIVIIIIATIYITQQLQSKSFMLLTL